MLCIFGSRQLLDKKKQNKPKPKKPPPKKTLFVGPKGEILTLLILQTFLYNTFKSILVFTYFAQYSLFFLMIFTTYLPI